jgi:ferredoxin-NADP reductase
MKIWEGALKLLSVETVARDTKKFQFARPTDFEFEAGQFVSMEFGKNVWRAYSIASEPSEKKILEFIVRIVPGGIASGVFDTLKPEETLWTKGAFGRFVRSSDENAELIFCATGTGIAPIRSMICAENVEKKSRKMKLFFGGRTPADLAYLDELSETENLEMKLGFSRTDDFGNFAKMAETCRITKFLEEENFSDNAEFYVCGNGEMVVETVKLLETKIPGAKIFHERFT